MKTVFVRIGGRLTRVITAGQGPALVLIHPVGYPADVFARNIGPLSQAFTVIAPDLPGQGFSEPPERWHGAPQNIMHRLVLDLVDELGFDRFHVAGSSLGGLIAALLALRDSDRVLSLTVLGSGSVFNDPAGQPAVLQQVYANGSRAYSDPSFERCRERMTNTCHRLPEAGDILLTQMTAYAWPGALESYRAIIEGLAASIADPGASVYPHLERIGVPTLVVVGANDPRTSIEAHQAGARRMLDARMIVYPECGHLPFLEQSDRFNRDLAEFAQGIDSSEAHPNE